MDSFASENCYRVSQSETTYAHGHQPIPPAQFEHCSPVELRASVPPPCCRADFHRSRSLLVFPNNELARIPLATRGQFARTHVDRAPVVGRNHVAELAALFRAGRIVGLRGY